MPESFHFLRPDWLWALLPAALLVVTAWRSRPSSGAWARICDAHLLRHLAVDGDGTARRWPLVLLGLGWAAAVTALAGPAWEMLPQPSYTQKTPTVIALDMSRSMGIDDVSPSRLERARFKVIDALQRLDGGQIGLIVYAEEPFVAAPLTDDPNVIRDMVPTLETRIMPGTGSRTDRAIAMAHDLLDQADAGHGRVLLIADGVGAHVEEAEAAATSLVEAGHQLAVLGVGTEEGGALPGLNRRDGSVITVGLESDRLRRVAEAADGAFETLTADDTDLARLLGRPLAADPLDQAFEKTDSEADTWRDMGVWLVLLPLALAPLAFRRGWLAALLVGAGLAQGLPAPARAGWLDDLWARPDQQGIAALEAGDPAAAARLFEDPAWRAAAHYRAEAYDAAAKSLADRIGAADRYNLGNALAQSGKIEEAIAAYDLALETDPDHEDAAYNRDLLKRLLEEEKKREEQQKQQEQQQSEQDKGQQGQDQKQAQGRQGQDQKQAQGQQGQDQTSQAAVADEIDDTTGERQISRDEREALDATAREASDDSWAMGRPSETAPETPPRSRGSSDGTRRLDYSERNQALEQMLRRVPDDPGGLLRAKLYRRYAERRYDREEVTQPW